MASHPLGWWSGQEGCGTRRGWRGRDRRPVRRDVCAVNGPGRTAARGLGVIGLCAAGFTALSTVLPGPQGFDRVGVLVVCVATVLASLVMFIPLWERFDVRTTLAMVPVGLALIAVHNAVGAVDPFRYGVFYLLLFV